eukprot:15366629-Ditylum_brightwellii.AAC.1
MDIHIPSLFTSTHDPRRRCKRIYNYICPSHGTLGSSWATSSTQWLSEGSGYSTEINCLCTSCNVSHRNVQLKYSDIPPETYSSLHGSQTQQHDQYLILWFASLGASNEDLIALNRCHVVIEAISLADIVTDWPNSNAMNSDLVTWKTYLHKGLNDNHYLPTPLGKWTSHHHSTDIWHYDSQTSTLCQHIE